MAKAIRTHLKSARKTEAQFAADLGISKAHLSLILSGKRHPSLTLALRIEDQTGVPVRDFSKVA